MINFYKFAQEAEKTPFLDNTFSNLFKLVKAKTRDEEEDEKKFNVSTWLTNPASASLIYNDNQRLSVLHQALVKFFSSKNISSLLPNSCAEEYEIFNENTQVGHETPSISMLIEKDKISIQKNIPLRIHSAVVILDKYRGKQGAEITLKIFANGGYDHSNHELYFYYFSCLSGIELLSSEASNGNLIIKFKTNNKEDLEFLSKSIKKLLNLTKAQQDPALNRKLTEQELLYGIFVPKKKMTKMTKEEFKEKILKANNNKAEDKFANFVNNNFKVEMITH